MSAAERDEWGEEFARMSDPRGTTAERLAYLIDNAALVGDMRDHEWVELAVKCLERVTHRPTIAATMSLVARSADIVREASQ